MYNMDSDFDAPQHDYREELKKTILIMLGDGSVDIELDDNHLEVAIDNAIRNYRAWGSNSMEEAFLYMKLYTGESVYTLPKEVQVLRKIYRRGNGVVSGNTSTVDPFSLAYSNTYLLSATRGFTGGSLLTYHLYHSFNNDAGMMFGRDIMFTFNAFTKKMVIERDVRGEEDVLLHVYQKKPEVMLFETEMIYPWIRDWALSEAMIMLGRARGKFSSIPGPQSTVSMDGDRLRDEGLNLQEQLKQRLKNREDGGEPLGFIIG